MRTSVGVIVIVMGLLGVMLAVTTGNIYQRFVLENQRTIFRDLADIKINFILSDTIKKTSDLGMSIQADENFRKAFREKDEKQVSALLNEQFHQFIVSTSILRLEKLYAFDQNFTIAGYSTGNGKSQAAEDVPCQELIGSARLREGHSRLRILSGMCLFEGRANIAVIVPLGGLRLEGYLLLSVDSTPNLIHVEEEMGMPLKLMLSDMTTAYESEDWNELSEIENILYWEYTLLGIDNRPVYIFNFAADMTPFYSKLEDTRKIMYIVAGVVTLLAALISFLMLQRAALDPIAQLTRQLQRVKKDKKYLGEKVHVKGNNEMADLADHFNDMSSELGILYKTLEKMAFTDMLTRLPNRTVFYDRLVQAVNIAQRQNTPFAVMMMDLDKFKWVNDTLGHHIGDKLLKEISSRLRSCMRKSDTVARLGGDEFAALLPGLKEQADAKLLANKIVEAIAKPMMLDGHDLTCGISIGIVYCPEHGIEGDQLVQRADVAMYHAKKKRQGFMIYEPALDKHSLYRLNMEQELSAAIKNGDLELHYQPRINLIDGRVDSAEALIRWNHPERGYLLPDEFVPLIEQSNLIHEMTQWVFTTVMQDCAQWHKENLIVGASVNLSRRNLDDMRVVEIVNSTLMTSGIDPQWLCLELTESIMASDSEKITQILKHLHGLGARLSVDNFGTGQFSLAHLGRLPIDEIKIDKTFIQHMEQDGSEAVIVRSMIDLAHNMGIRTVAEGVESQQVRDLLLEMGCDAAQGFFFCRPIRAEEFAVWFKENQSAISRRKIKAV